MNERIRELAKWAGYNGHYATEEFDVDEFARLLVLECAERLLHDVKLTDIQTTRCVASIKEHFGVEE